MPVLATPATAPPQPCCSPELPTNEPPAPVSCSQQAILSAPISAVQRKPLLSRMRGVVLTQGQIGVIRWQMHDTAGAPVDLSGCGFDNGEGNVGEESISLSTSWASLGLDAHWSIRFRMRECLSFGSDPECRFLDCEAQVVDAGQGKVEITLKPGDTARAGIYFGEMALVQDYDTPEQGIIFSNIFYVTIQPGQFGGPLSNSPPTMAEVRLALRDSSASESFLVDAFKFDDAEIAFAAHRTISYWNEALPPIPVYYNTSNFPYRFHMLEGIIGQLFYMIEEQQRANNLDYSAAGVAVNDQNKEMNYQRAGDRRWQAWQQFVRAKKASINLTGFYGTLGSRYGDSY